MLKDTLLFCSSNVVICVLIDLCGINIFNTHVLIKMGWNQFPFSVPDCARVHERVSAATWINTLKTKDTRLDWNLSEISNKAGHSTKRGITSEKWDENLPLTSEPASSLDQEFWLCQIQDQHFILFLLSKKPSSNLFIVFAVSCLCINYRVKSKASN